MGHRVSGVEGGEEEAKIGASALVCYATEATTSKHTFEYRWLLSL